MGDCLALAYRIGEISETFQRGSLNTNPKRIATLPPCRVMTVPWHPTIIEPRSNCMRRVHATSGPRVGLKALHGNRNLY